MSELLQNVFSASTVSFLSQHGWQQREYEAIRLSLGYNYAHVSGSNPPLLTSVAPTPTRATPTSRPKPLSSFMFSFRKWLIPHCCLCGWSAHQCLKHLRPGWLLWELVFSFTVGPHMKPHLLRHHSACSSHFPPWFIAIKYLTTLLI